jgi:hypothetical protein
MTFLSAASEIVIPTLAAGQAPSTQVIMYSQFELYKIWFSTAMLVMAILILTFIAYRWQQNRYKRWVYEQDVEEAKRIGKSVSSIPAPIYKKVINKPLILAFGVFICAAGIIQFVI